MPLKPQDQEKTAFSKPSGLFEFTVLPFGLHGAPAMFQRLMNRVLSEHQAYSSAYLDDIVIYSPTWETHLHHCQLVFQALRAAGLHISAKKSRAGFQKVKYLGYILGNGHIESQEEKVRAISQAPFHATEKEVRAFLGLLGYYRRFIPQYSKLSSPLTDLLKKNVKPKDLLHPPHEALQAFQNLKRAITSGPILQSPDFSKPFLLQTDASENGLGAVLSQVSSEGIEHPILFISQKLFPREQGYSIIEKECLAIKWAVDKLRYYLEGSHFLLNTDHAPLLWMSRKKGNNQRVLRWFLALQPFSFEVRHRRGSENGNADFLSRLSLFPDREQAGVGVCDDALPGDPSSFNALTFGCLLTCHPVPSFVFRLRVSFLKYTIPLRLHCFLLPVT